MTDPVAPRPFTCRARIVARGWDKTKAGAPIYVLDWEVTHGPAQYRRVMQRLNFSEKGAKYAAFELRRMGWRGSDLATLDGAAIPTEHTIEVSARIDGEKTYYDVSVLGWIPKPGVMSAEQLARLTANSRAGFAEADKELGLVTTERAREPGDDDGEFR